MKLEMVLPDSNAFSRGLEASENSNTATRHILEGGLYIKSLAQALTYRVADVFRILRL
jgi:hypothetical protein